MLLHWLLAFGRKKDLCFKETAGALATTQKYSQRIGIGKERGEAGDSEVERGQGERGGIWRGERERREGK